MFTSPINASNSPPEHIQEFTQKDSASWINSKPLSVKDLKGKVVLIDFWTFGCWNCYRSFPWLNSIDEKYRDKGLSIIGIHTPEFEHEKVRANIEKKISEFKLHHPVMMDNNYAYWNTLNNRYWPAFYLYDQEGILVHTHFAETHAGDKNAQSLEKKIMQLISKQ